MRKLKVTMAILAVGLWVTVPAITQAQMSSSQGSGQKVVVPDSVAAYAWLNQCNIEMGHAPGHLDSWLARPNNWQWGMSDSDRAALKTLVLNWIQNENEALASYHADKHPTAEASEAYYHKRAQTALKFLEKDVPAQLTEAGAKLFKQSVEALKASITIDVAVTE